jgi:hypothetical protein
MDSTLLILRDSVAENLIISDRITILTNRIAGDTLNCINSSVFYFLDETHPYSTLHHTTYVIAIQVVST